MKVTASPSEFSHFTIQIEVESKEELTALKEMSSLTITIPNLFDDPIKSGVRTILRLIHDNVASRR